MAQYLLSQNPNVPTFVVADGERQDFDTIVVDTGASSASLSISQRGGSLVISDGTNTAVLGAVQLAQVSTLQFRNQDGSVISVGDNSPALADDAAQVFAAGGQFPTTANGDFVLAAGGNDTVQGVYGDDQVFLNAGADFVDFDGSGFPSTGNSTVYGGMDNDIVNADGASGNNLIFGNSGEDVVNGGFSGGNGRNTVFGGQGSDIIDFRLASTGQVLYGDFGSDTIFGSMGDDAIFGGADADALYGSRGRDTLFGGQNDDLVFGGQDEDALLGNLGTDVLYGNNGADSLYGGQGNDTLYGGQGDDILSGDLGDDVLSGDQGADRYVFGANSGNDRVLGFDQASGDRLDLQGQTYTFGQPIDGNAVLVLSGGGTVELAGVTQAQVNDGFFTA